MNFELRAKPLPTENEVAFWFVFNDNKMLVKLNNDSATVPFIEDIQTLNIKPINKQYIGRLDGHPCFVAEVISDEITEKNIKFTGIRQLFGLMEEDLFWLAGRAFQLMYWNRNNQFCGRCGSKTEDQTIDHGKVCPECGLITYPRISPAIIVAITKGNEILLGQNVRNKGRFYSVLAGFVEPGETLEECVCREVKEEAGIEIKNVHYFSSQPWPFPDSLMVAFTAEYDSGEINIDEDELCDAKWFSVDTLPEIPSSISVARKLIDWFIDNNK